MTLKLWWTCLLAWVPISIQATENGSWMNEPSVPTRSLRSLQSDPKKRILFFTIKKTFIAAENYQRPIIEKNRETIFYFQDFQGGEVKAAREYRDLIVGATATLNREGIKPTFFFAGGCLSICGEFLALANRLTSLDQARLLFTKNFHVGFHGAYTFNRKKQTFSYSETKTRELIASLVEVGASRSWLEKNNSLFTVNRRCNGADRTHCESIRTVPSKRLKEENAGFLDFGTETSDLDPFNSSIALGENHPPPKSSRFD